ncbi:tetratricopeptide repeat protein [Cobetia sp. LC6]|uniref:tetratricopeptide repeat protein n=1 Tax=Cobetia sp. LC6 TaxID=3050947 RepID=UPI002555FC83|nr:tetratricopeptide repeat protein [Cobetia sp. LC6]MDL2193034.1 tetratricopeptide repeat protein [Cobetia sp. LC6]
MHELPKANDVCDFLLSPNADKKTIYLDILKKGVELRNGGNYLDAEMMLHYSSWLNPSDWQSWYELGVLYQVKKNIDQAVFYYKAALKCGSVEQRLIGNFLCVTAVQESLCKINNKAIDTIDLGGVVLDDSDDIKDAFSFSGFVESHPQSLINKFYNVVNSKHNGFLNFYDIKNKILDAVDRKKSFALLRLGDGEGSWFKRSSHVELQFERILSRNRCEFLDIWFGNSSSIKKSDFFDDVNSTFSRLNEVDVLGIPPKTWVEHEFYTANKRGYVGTLGALESLKGLSSSVGLCTQLMHFEFERRGFLKEVLSKAKKVGIISCHNELKEFIEKNFDVNDVELIKIPGELSRKHLLGDDAVVGNHYPDRFFEITKRIKNTNYEGYVFLVAGGILAKSYVLDLKQSGAIALDIGSVADKLLGRKTRPNF